MKIFHGLNNYHKNKGNNLLIFSNTIELLFFILISKIKSLICYEVFFIFIFRDFCRSLFIMARFSSARKLEMF